MLPLLQLMMMVVVIMVNESCQDVAMMWAMP